MSDLRKPIEFNEEDSISIEVPVTIHGEEFVLREASGDATARFVNARTSTFKIGPDGRINGLQNVGDLPSLLVSMCLFDEQGKLVNRQKIKNWPNRIQETLFNRALDMSNLRVSNVTMTTQLKAMMDEDDSPLSYADLVSWVHSHNDPDTANLRALIRQPEDSEETSKNSSALSEDGS